MEVLYKLGYGLYLLSAKANERDNACIINTFMQVTDESFVMAVNKQHLTHDMILSSKEFNISVLTTKTPFSIFERFGFQTGKNADKFVGFDGISHSKNNLKYLTQNTNSFLSFEVTDIADYNTHTLFTAKMTDSGVLSKDDSLTYSYYHQFVKPKPTAKSGWRCTICNFVYDGELPKDYICPICKRDASVFVKEK
ncbi:MAG: flavin reductase [Firmicutes bacterium]|nr:flavin reductase [Bacillota bacterium]